MSVPDYILQRNLNQVLSQNLDRWLVLDWKEEVAPNQRFAVIDRHTLGLPIVADFATQAEAYKYIDQLRLQEAGIRWEDSGFYQGKFLK